MSTVMTSHINVDERGVAWIDDTNIKVIEVVMEKRATGASPEELEFQHQGVLSLAQIYAGLAYYFDHQADMDAAIERQAQEYEARRAQSLSSPGREKPRAMKKQP